MHQPYHRSVTLISSTCVARYHILKLERAGVIKRTPGVARSYVLIEKPQIVCICGSSRFADVAAVAAWEFEKRGQIALGLHLLPSWYTQEKDHLAEFEGVAEILDELHLRKIEMADEVFVINVNGYIGERTRIEIEYAKSLGKPVKFLYDRS